MNTPLDGQITLTLNGEPAVLTPSLGAAMELCRLHGSFMALFDKVASLDLPAAADVVRCGLGKPASEAKAVAEAVYATGLFDLMPRLSAYIYMLANGGKPRVEEAEADDDGAPFPA